ncbi:nuclear transport factor 2 family protein [Microbacterium sp. NPDC019599]|uniref:nuclear transport factor 2 family protein n=1 Tax=Microbacterium sp. NPDC019599 TaxID=3154690 RepID=UPI0033F046D8
MEREYDVVTIQDEVLGAAERRAAALAAGDERALRMLLHPAFGWTSHTGEHFDRDSYLAGNLRGPTRWHSQLLTDPKITVVGGTAVLRCVVVDDVTTSAGRSEYRMPMTQMWVRAGGQWQCLAGHAGPRISAQ